MKAKELAEILLQHPDKNVVIYYPEYECESCDGTFEIEHHNIRTDKNRIIIS